MTKGKDIDAPEPPPRKIVRVDTRGRKRKLPMQALFFCDLIVAGHSQASAWRIAYKHPKASSEDAAEYGWRVANRPGVKERIEDLYARSSRKVLLSLNDRLAILSDIAQDKTASRNEKVRAVEVYSKISGDQAPERHELTGKDGAPIPVAATAMITRVGVRDRIAMLKAAREGQK